MENKHLLIPTALALAGLAASTGPASAQVRQAPSAAAQPVASDSNALFAGDWAFTIQMHDSTVGGTWRLNYTQGRFTGIVTRPGAAPAQISSVSVHGKDLTLVAAFAGGAYTFTGHMENPRNITGSVAYPGGSGALRAQKRT